jgi:uncharacterized protein (TIGR02246 family)
MRTTSNVTKYAAPKRPFSPEQEVRAALDEWLDAVSNHQAARVAGLYAEDAVLLATFASDVLNNPQARMAYFERFTSLKDLTPELVECHTRVHGDTAINSGIYYFRHRNDGPLQTVKARFSFTYRATDNGWQIVDHHSSVIPE